MEAAIAGWMPIGVVIGLEEINITNNNTGTLAPWSQRADQVCWRYSSK
jgi:hypothetical protein